MKPNNHTAKLNRCYSSDSLSTFCYITTSDWLLLSSVLFHICKPFLNLLFSIIYCFLISSFQRAAFLRFTGCRHALCLISCITTHSHNALSVLCCLFLFNSQPFLYLLSWPPHLSCPPPSAPSLCDLVALSSSCLSDSLRSRCGGAAPAFDLFYPPRQQTAVAEPSGRFWMSD